MASCKICGEKEPVMHCVCAGCMDKLEHRTRWISVKERLPKLPNAQWASRMVIACYDNDRVSPMIYERTFVRGKSVERWKYHWDRIADVEVTHWMPLPEPPEEGEADAHD